MSPSRVFPLFLVVLYLSVVTTATPTSIPGINTPRPASTNNEHSGLRFWPAHNHVFSPSDGWAPTNISTDSQPEDGGTRLQERDRDRSRFSKRSLIKAILPKGQDALSKLLSSLSDIFPPPKGKSEPVIITWYTGHDLLNPSCWSKDVWKPTDNHFVGALTLSGWNDRPPCGSFMQLCNGDKNCVFVRVVDSCAGCAKGSHHVDLTKSAFEKLFPLSKGTGEVHMRQVGNPSKWYEALWGPTLPHNEAN